MDDRALDFILKTWEQGGGSIGVERTIRIYLNVRYMSLQTQKPLFPPGVTAATMAADSYKKFRRLFDELGAPRSPDRARPRPAKRVPKDERGAGSK